MGVLLLISDGSENLLELLAEVLLFVRSQLQGFYFVFGIS